MTRLFQIVSRVVVVLAVGCLVAAIWRPGDYSSFMNIGLTLLVIAFAASLSHHYLLRSPIPVRGGSLLTMNRNPISYRAWYIIALLFCGFLLYVLLP